MASVSTTGPPNTTVRRYESGDAQRCCDLINEAIVLMDGLNAAARAHVIASNVPERLGADLQRWTTLVVDSHGTIVALGAVDNEEIKRVYVDPVYQGGGVATMLMSELENIAWSDGQAIVRLEASPSSVGFYEGLGYASTGDDELIIGEASFSFVQMQKLRPNVR